jgi:hypothetical protein
MKFLIIAAPKSASTSLMSALGQVTNLKTKQEYFYTDNGSHLENRLLVRVLKKFFAGIYISSLSHKEEKKLRCIYPAVEYSLLSKFHSDIADFDEDTQLNKILNYDIHKQHFPPTQNNLNLLKTTKKIILLRSPSDIVKSYLREPYNESLFPLQKKIKSDSNFFDSLEKELTLWVDGWHKSEKDDENSLIIYYDELVSDHVNVLKKIIEFYNYPISISSNFKLPKKRFTKI